MKKWWAKAKNWLKRFFRWMGEGWPVFTGIGVVMLACLVGFFCKTELAVKAAGLGLQIFGMGLAIWGVLGLRKHFGQRPYRLLFLDWLGRFPKWKQSVTVLGESAGILVNSAFGVAHAWYGDDPGKPLEERLKRIVRNVESLRDRQGKSEHEIRELPDDFAKHKKAADAAIAEAQVKARKELTDAHTRDVLYSLIGIVWLMVGAAMATFAPELSWLFS